MTHMIHAWDYREQPDLAALGEAIRQLSRGAVDLRAVPETGSDQYAVVVADHPLSRDDAQAVWDDAGAADEEVWR